MLAEKSKPGSRRYTILHTTEGGGPGGAETVLLELASNLDPSRFRSLALLTSDDWLKRQLLSRNVPTTLVKSKAWYYFQRPRAMIKLIRQERVDLIHSHLPGQNFYGCLAGRLTGRKVIATYHGTPGLTGTAGIKEIVKAAVVRNVACAIVAVSDYLKRILLDLRYPPKKIVRIYNGVDIDRFGQHGSGKIRAELGIAAQTKVVGMIANFRQSKGYEYFVQAAHRISSRIPDVRFIAVGDIEEAMRGRMCKLLQKMNLESRFHLLGFRSDIPEILNDLDVFVLSSTDEGLSIATIEAMAARRPVVVTRSGGPQEIVEDGITGFLVTPADPQALAARVLEILVNPELGMRLGEEGRRDVERRFALPVMVKEYEDLYQRCLEAD